MSTITATTTCYQPVGSGRRAPSQPRAGRAPVRLTRRGRAAVVLLLLVLALGVTALLRTPATATATRADRPVAERVTVAPGQTLWQIAERAVPGTDPRVTVERIREMNGLESSGVQAGRVLMVPVSG